MTPITPIRKSWTNTFTLAFAPALIFPLLCPVREYEWIEDWRGELVYSASGVAEDGCIFRTELAGAGTMTWIVSRYEPNIAIEFACVVAGVVTMRLKIALRASGGATELHWTREFTSLSTEGDEWIAHQTDADASNLIHRIEAMLRHYLATGTMLRAADVASHARQ